jgi:hypothetical protein
MSVSKVLLRLAFLVFVSAFSLLSSNEARGAILLTQSSAVNWIFQPETQGAGGNFGATELEYFFDNDDAPAGWDYVDSNPDYPNLTYVLGGDPVLTVLSTGYKSETNGPESGPAFASYSTAYAGNREYATINFTPGGTPLQRDHMFLIVKDGNSRPNLYVYDLNRIDQGNGVYEVWDGMESINIGNASHYLFGAQGCISHVEIVVGTKLKGGAESENVPEPASLAIWGGLGIAGLIAARRRKQLAV